MQVDEWQLSGAVHETALSTTQLPARQEVVVHKLPSSQGVLSASGLTTHWPVEESQVDEWQSSGAVHVTELSTTQLPAWQLEVVQALPSSHGVLSGSASTSHCPVAGLHVDEWHKSGAEHETRLSTTQLPAWQVEVVQRLPSSHGVLSGRGFTSHWPVLGLQVDEWQESGEEHETTLSTTQLPAWQVEVAQRFPLPQGVLSGSGLTSHWPLLGLQVDVWHMSGAEQVTTESATQLPAWQVLVMVHALPSSQGVPSVMSDTTQVPVLGLHEEV